jgi:hypothetical protein
MGLKLSNMKNNLLAITQQNEELTRELELLHLEFLDLFTRHKDMIENESFILTSLYLEKLGHLQLELLEKQTEASRLKMKMNLIQSAINRNERPDLKAIEKEINSQLQTYYAQILAQSAELDEAKKVLSHLIPEEETQKLKEIFRVLCKRLHPDLNPNQTEEEKDLFIKVKAAYDLKRLIDLQNILLFLDDSDKEKLKLISSIEKVERIRHLENQVQSLKLKIDHLKQSFPFSIKELILDENSIVLKQEELRIKIQTAEEEINKYSNIINIMADE